MVNNMPNSSSGHQPSLETTLNIYPNNTPHVTPIYASLETLMHSPIEQTQYISQDQRPQTFDYDRISNNTEVMAPEDMANSSFSSSPRTSSLRSGTSSSSRKSSGNQTSVYPSPKGSETNPDPDAVTELDDPVPRTAICQTIVVYQGRLSENGSSRGNYGRDFEAEQTDDGSGMRRLSTSTRDVSARGRANMLLGLASSSLQKTTLGELSLDQAGVGSYVSRRKPDTFHGNDASNYDTRMSPTSGTSCMFSSQLPTSGPSFKLIQCYL